MEKIEFSNHVEFVEAARKLLTEDYPIAFDHERQTCLYRMTDKEGKERRCIIGRLFYGHIPETHEFWNSSREINYIAKHSNFLKNLFPWMNWGFAATVQDKHDSLAGISMVSRSWEDLLRKAAELDRG